jgi:hypothetical protein
LHSKLTRRARLRALALAVPAAALAVAVVAPGAIGADEAPTPGVVKIVETEKLPQFVSPGPITAGEQLEVLNLTSPKRFGPHTFSLVTEAAVPKTGPARKKCNTSQGICMKIAGWHKFNPKTEQIGVDLAKAGAAGWSTLGSTSKTGDSWYTEEKGDSITQKVAASAPSTLYFLCAVHPWMHGKVEVETTPTS